MKSVELSDKATEFLNLLAQQNVTLPRVFVDDLQWNRWTKEEIRGFLDEINKATR